MTTAKEVQKKQSSDDVVTPDLASNPPRSGKSKITHRPTKHFRLTCWRLLYHVDVQKTLDRQEEIAACQHSLLRLDQWDEQKAFFPREWTKLIAKRQRRLIWFAEHGSIKDGWTPPDPQDPRRSAHKPIHAYLARHGLTLDAFIAKYRFVPMKPKKGGHKPNRPLIRRIMAWTKNRKTPEGNTEKHPNSA